MWEWNGTVQTNRGVELACLLLGDEILYTTVEIDKFALVANLVALVNVSSDLSASSSLPLSLFTSLD